MPTTADAVALKSRVFQMLLARRGSALDCLYMSFKLGGGGVGEGKFSGRLNDRLADKEF